MRYTIKEISEKLKMTNRGIRARCTRLGIKKFGKIWNISEEDFKRIKYFQNIRVFRPNFYFSENGDYLIINSRMNQTIKS